MVLFSDGSMHPQRFELEVTGPALHDETFAVSLLFSMDQESKDVSLPSLLCFTHDVDVVVSILKKLRPIAWWKRKAIVEWALRDTSEVAAIITAHSPEDAATLASAGQERVDRVAQLPVTRKRNRVTDNLLDEVAEIYRSAWKRGDSPTKAVAAAKNFSYSHAAHLVGLSRKRGKLGPPAGPQGGEIATLNEDRKD
jgi:hypothetical protein